MPHLRCFLHMSTFGTVFNQPWLSSVHEQLYPLPLNLNNQFMTHVEFVQQLMSMPSETADELVRPMLERLGFGYAAYAFGKSLTEQLVAAADIGQGVSKVIVRPSMVTATAGEPYPRYLTGYAGFISYIMAYAVGLFPGHQSVAWSADLLLDLIPCDVVANLTLAAAAAGLPNSAAGLVDAQPVIYHATSSHTRVLEMYRVYQFMSKFWRANPLPYALPDTRYIEIPRWHQPDTSAVEAARQHVDTKIQQHCTDLISRGLTTEAKILKTTFAAFNILNRTHYNRSVVCSVDNVKALAARLDPKDRQEFNIVWDASGADLEAYMNTFQAAIRCLLLRVDTPVQGVRHNFCRVTEYHAVVSAEKEPSGDHNVIITAWLVAGVGLPLQILHYAESAVQHMHMLDQHVHVG
eukprot:GHUV01011346.1.p1 GENE.GHUV01011346.1~~GHUV01011346.1.p1  ORF type:complete len:407 (+),score=76.81 GHUV01011346.1:611-1831(+)